MEKLTVDMLKRFVKTMEEGNKEFAKKVKCTYTGKCDVKGRMCQCCSYYKPKGQKKN